MVENKHQIPALTGLRGYAALWVVALHFTFGSQRGGEGFLYDIAWHGSAGVIVFFVLSGFILSHVYCQAFDERVTKSDYVHFLFYRLVRIYPLYVVTLIAWLLIFNLGGYLVRSQDTPMTFFLNLTMLQAWGFIDGLTWNDPAWTVSVEWFFYLFFPFLALAVFRLHWVMLVAIVSASIAVIWVQPLALQSLGVALPGPFSYGRALAIHVGAFVAGVALYPVVRSASKFKWWPRVSDLLVMAGLALFAYFCTIVFKNWLASLASLLVIAGLYSGGGLGKILFGSTPIVYLGKISYSLYLTHVLLLVILNRELPDAPFLLSVLIAIAFAAAVHHWVEEPLRRRGRALWPVRSDDDSAPVSSDRITSASEPASLQG